MGLLSAAAGKTILIVDDEPEVLDAMREFLESNLDRVRILAAASGQDGLAVLSSHRADLVISDFNMPGMNGAQFLAHARQIQPDIRQIIVTAFLSEALGTAGLSTEGELMLQKPFGPEALLRDVEEALSPDKP